MYIMINTNTEEIVTKKKKVSMARKTFLSEAHSCGSSDFASGRLLAKNFTSSTSAFAIVASQSHY